jgi:hypothetical protein
MKVTCSTRRIGRISGLCAVKVEYFAGERGFPKQLKAGWFFAFSFGYAFLLVAAQTGVKRYASEV